MIDAHSMNYVSVLNVSEVVSLFSFVISNRWQNSVKEKSSRQNSLAADMVSGVSNTQAGGHGDGGRRLLSVIKHMGSAFDNNLQFEHD
jgi:hypothetical protein